MTADRLPRPDPDGRPDRPGPPPWRGPAPVERSGPQRPAAEPPTRPTDPRRPARPRRRSRADGPARGGASGGPVPGGAAPAGQARHRPGPAAEEPRTPPVGTRRSRHAAGPPDRGPDGAPSSRRGRNPAGHSWTFGPTAQDQRSTSDVPDRGGRGRAPRAEGRRPGPGGRALRGLAGVLAGGLVVLGLGLLGTEWLAGRNGVPGPGAGTVAAHLAGAVTAVVGQAVADRRADRTGTLAALGVLAVAALVLGFGWFL